MENKKPGLLIAATKSGSGKTTITCALLRALLDMGVKVQAFKSGPDYIDPMFHEKIIGTESRNLDIFMAGEELLNELYFMDNYGQLSILEGAMGLYDGLDPRSTDGSAYQMACVLGLPIVLLVDARGMGRSMLAEIAGFLSLDTERLIAGVILNRISSSYFSRMKPIIEEELGIKVFGYLPVIAEANIDSRYLGLKLPNEIDDLKGSVQRLADVFKENVNLKELISSADSRAYAKKEISLVDSIANVEAKRGLVSTADVYKDSISVIRSHRPRIAIASDEAFCFYYRDNIKLLEDLGAEIVYFSPMRDDELPSDTAGIILGGGYPELYLKELENNKRMRTAILDASISGIPILAECGGFMYLHDSIEDKSGIKHKMVGVIDGNCFYAGHLVRFGYVEIQGQNPFQAGTLFEIKGHEFHYYDSDNNGEACVIKKASNGSCYKGEYFDKSIMAGFPHLYYPSCVSLIVSYLKACINF